MAEVSSKKKFKVVMKFGLKVIGITTAAIIVNSIFAFMFNWYWLFVLGLMLLPTFGIIIGLLIDNHIYWGDIDEKLRNENERKSFRETIGKIKERFKKEDKTRHSKDNRPDNRNDICSNSKSVLCDRESVLGNDNGIHREHRRRKEKEEKEIINIPLPPDNINTIIDDSEFLEDKEFDISDIDIQEMTEDNTLSTYLDEPQLKPIDVKTKKTKRKQNKKKDKGDK